ncbi:hypothetical protein [Brachybacterium paraconglomeratum]|uniref:hypothetical protein n=1 Tax=Brachybacterium paraconglomeratum TaxID=173362 RepID=UPI0022AF9016|nr:hypothetical protein [Brachybacterium paraconglomeratum]MCZ4325659.1 hypothetical protein [Brachybacterium paraconglomeratum]
MEIPPWMLGLGAALVASPGAIPLLKWLVSVITGRADATRAAESARITALAEREERASLAMREAMERLDTDVKRLSADAERSRERIGTLETENRTLRGRFDRLDRAVRIALSRLHDLIRWEEAGKPPPPPWSIQSIADLLTEDKDTPS